MVFAFSMINVNAQNNKESDEIVYPYTFKASSNPIFTHIRTADPDCHVWQDGKLWVYTSQDHDSDPETKAKVGHGYSKMDGYHVFSTENMVDWIDYGEILHSKNVPWGCDDGGWMWAPGAAYKNGIYYLYFPSMNKEMVWKIGVATSKNPQGPFVAEPTYMEGTSGIDPMCFIDDDGQAYLYFGDALVAKLSDDMLTLAEEPRKINYEHDNFREGPYMHKREGVYYYSWTDWKDKVDQGYYALGDNPYGPFKYKGAVNVKAPGAQDHHSIIEYKNQWYYFYHIGNYTNKLGEEGRGYRRNVCVDYLYYNNDGTMKKVIQTEKSVRKLIK